MKRFFTALVAVSCLGVAMNSLAAEPLETGDNAPEFKLPGSDGETYQLSDFKGKKTVIIAWYPKAFTGG